jgi:capsular polysaccharide biosynthesis protein
MYSMASHRAMGYDCELLPLEAMTLYEQMNTLRSLDVMVGMHGSALDNCVFMQKNSVMVQLYPFLVHHPLTFPGSAASAGR